MADVHTLELFAGQLTHGAWLTLFTVPTGFVYVPTCIDITAELGATYGTSSGRITQDKTDTPLVLGFVVALPVQYSRGFWHWQGRREISEGASWYGWADPGDTNTVSLRITGYKLTLP